MTRWSAEPSCFFAMIVTVMAPMLGSFLTCVVVGILFPGANTLSGFAVVVAFGAPVAGFPAALISLLLVLELSTKRGVTTIAGVLIGAVTAALWAVVLMAFVGMKPVQGQLDAGLTLLCVFAAIGAVSALSAIGLGIAFGTIVDFVPASAPVSSVEALESDKKPL